LSGLYETRKPFLVALKVYIASGKYNMFLNKKDPTFG